MKKAAKLRELAKDELEQKMRELRREYFEQRKIHAVSKQENPLLERTLRREIARATQF